MNKRQLRNVAKLIPAIVWIGIVTWLSLKPTSELPAFRLMEIPNADKVLHAGVYAAMGFLLMFGLQGNSRQTQLFSIAICLIWGVAMEVLQLSSAAGRHFEIADIIANIIGSLAGVAAFTLLFK